MCRKLEQVESSENKRTLSAEARHCVNRMTIYKKKARLRSILRMALASEGGGGGIRTPEGFYTLPVFKTGAINRSTTPPECFFV